jgi:FKBP-type peptidyl-prolyl cis-trans isomerase (trigger factor)
MTDKISSVVAKESNGNIQITFTIPYDLIQKAQEETIEEMAKDVEVPGFRKGTAPLSKVREKIPQNTIIEHSLGHILPKALAETITAEKLKLAIYPKFELIKADPDEAWQIRGITCELPEVPLGEYKKTIAGEIRAASLKKEPTKEEKEGVVIKALIENTKIVIPQVLIEEEADGRLSNLLARIEKLGLTLESYMQSIGKSPESLRAEYSTQAKEAISLDLILTKIAEAEGIKVDPKEVDAAFNMSEASRPEKSEHPEDTENRKRLLESILRRRKALDFLTNLS